MYYWYAWWIVWIFLETETFWNEQFSLKSPVNGFGINMGKNLNYP